MISVDEYLACADRGPRRLRRDRDQLGDDLVNARLDGIPGSNSAFALVAHIWDDGGLGAHGQPRHPRAARPGRRVHRQRDGRRGARPAGAHPGAAARGRSSGIPRELPADPAHEKDGTLSCATQGAVLLHVYEELAQHLGQLEVTRDVLLARGAASA